MEAKKVVSSINDILTNIGLPTDESVSRKQAENRSKTYLKEAEQLRELIESECADISDYISLKLVKPEALIDMRDRALHMAQAAQEGQDKP